MRVNLLPPEILKQKKRRILFSMMRVSLILGWVIIVFLTAWFYYHYTSLSGVVSEKEKILNSLKRQLQREYLLKLFEEAEAFIKSIKAFTSDLAPVYELLICLSSSLPSGVKLDKFETLKDREVRIAGIVASPEALAEFLNTLKDKNFVENISLPILEKEKNEGIPFGFNLRLKSWW